MTYLINEWDLKTCLLESAGGFCQIATRWSLDTSDQVGPCANPGVRNGCCIIVHRSSAIRCELIAVFLVHGEHAWYADDGTRYDAKVQRNLVLECLFTVCMLGVGTLGCGMMLRC